jgi:hypothetical protein
MGRWRGPGSSRLGRILRLHRFDRNPLRRWPDRAETAVFGLLIAAFTATAPFAAHAAGSLTHAISMREQQSQGATLHRVPATLLKAAPDLGRYAGLSGAASETEARWRAPDGQVRTGLVPATSGAAKGSTIEIWVSQAGRPAAPPVQAAQVAARVVLAEMLAVAGLALAAIIVGWLARRVLDRRRMAAWDADWLATGPRWNTRR